MAQNVDLIKMQAGFSLIGVWMWCVFTETAHQNKWSHLLSIQNLRHSFSCTSEVTQSALYVDSDECGSAKVTNWQWKCEVLGEKPAPMSLS
jgi:hypothetical protein